MRFDRSQVLSLRAVRDGTTEDSTSKKKSGLARFKRWVINSTCCVGMGGLRKEILAKASARELDFAPVEGGGTIGLIADYEGPCPVSRGRRIVEDHDSHSRGPPVRRRTACARGR